MCLCTCAYEHHEVLGREGAVRIEIERRRLMAQAKMYAWLEKLIKLKLCYDE